jgi:hypothetical protein
MGNDPEAEKLQLLDGVRQCDNYLELLHQKELLPIKCMALKSLVMVHGKLHRFEQTM